MKHCEDCTHDEVCGMWAVDSGIPFVNAADCVHYKANAEPPVQAGDTVYRIYTRSWVGADRVEHILTLPDGRTGYTDDKGRFTEFSKFGELVFSTPEDAAKLLNE
jgi:hypothetical protein